MEIIYVLAVTLVTCLIENGLSLVLPEKIRQKRQVNNYDVRLVGSTIEGVVEVYVNGWKAICSRGFDLTAGDAVCRQLGYTSAKNVSSFNGDGVNSSIYYDGMYCRGSPARVSSCKLDPCRGDTCCFGTQQFAGVACQDLEVRLVNGDAYSGIVEVNYGSGWGVICDDDWTLVDADIVCLSLGYPGSERYTDTDEFEASASPVKCSKADCTGNEEHLRECGLSVTGIPDVCSPDKTIASVVCKKPFRLVDGNNVREGRVEVYINGVWSRVCDNGWGITDADVLCNSLGFPGALASPVGSHFGEGEITAVLLEDLGCFGNEWSILNCSRKTEISDSCVQDHDAGAVCRDIDECSSLPCGNGATCNDTIGGYTCICATGFEGTHCLDEIDECWSNPCKNQATCIDLIGSFSCQCAPGYDGEICDIDINECSSDPCGNRGICINNIDFFSCNCLPGFNGDFCENNIDECESAPCKNGAVCVDHDNSFHCVCLPGFSGLFCATDINECISSPCLNGGECSDRVNSYECECPAGYTGTICQIEIDECQSSPCSVNGQCRDEIGGFTCICNNGFVGSLCETDVDECSSQPCNNNGTCVNNIASFHCTCQPGFIGVTCETNFNECSTNPCVRGTCQDRINKYECVCPVGYYGDRCEIDRNECLSFPCQHGQCRDMVNSFNCTCDLGFEGTLCEIEINECFPNPCLNGGSCTDGPGDFTCICPPGFNGRFCENDIDNCLNRPCMNGGTCLDIGSHGFQCACVPGFDGFMCQTNIDECDSEPCQHNGTCHDRINGYQCYCEQGYEGESCESNIDECTSYPCLNQGSCTDGVNGFSCLCQNGFLGTRCEINTNECSSNPCLNYGQCIDGDGFYVCSCEGGYFGRRCELEGIRLVNGTSPYNGRVEVFYNNQWGTICNTVWNLNNARVVCRQMDTPGAIRAFSASPYGAGTGPIVLDQVNCSSGYESNIGECAHLETGIHSCSHEQDVAVECSKGVRLVGGGSNLQGIVEVFWNGAWGTICDDGWDIADAHVVCRELGFRGALQAVNGGSQFGQGNGNIVLDNVACLGTEERLINCGHTETGIKHCEHNEDAGVICLNSSSVRLADGIVPYEGRVEVNIDGYWGAVCDHWWDIQDAQVVCRQLGYPNAISAPGGSIYGPGTGEIVMDDVRCSGQESQLVECPRSALNQHTCGHYEVASAVCQNNIRLVNGNKETEGRVEVYLDGRWGTICDDSFDINAAHVVCQHLGFWEAIAFHREAHFGAGTIPVLLDDLHCIGNETKISDCEHSGIGIHNCLNTEDVSVVCKLEVRLADGATASEGRVEVYVEGGWGTVCDDGWDRDDGDVVCRQLGYDRAIRVTSLASFGQGSGYIVFDDVVCTGVEDSLIDCGHRGLGTHNCRHSEDAGVVCLTNDTIRLVGGSVDNEGRVEIFHNGQWGTICDDGWDITDATIACRQLGYSGAIEAPGSATYGQGYYSPIYLDDVDCSGTEDTILECGHRGLGNHNCQHSEDAGAVCIRSSNVRLVGGTVEYEGRVEIRIDGQWGTVCDDGWDFNEATVVCRQLGFYCATSAIGGAEFGPGIGTIHLSQLQCTGEEDRLDLCDYNGHASSCGHHNDAGVSCSPRVRLVGGLNSFEGRVEYYYNNQWGTVCDDHWDISDANVVCTELGFGSALEATMSALFGPGSGRIHLDDVQCNGEETNLAACNHNGFGQHNCGHHEDAGVRCGLSVRLVGGATASEGRVEIFYQGKWGTVCDDYWGVEDATVVCRSLSYSGISVAYPRAHFGQGTGPILLDNVHCIGTETDMSQCRSNVIGNHNCGHGEDAGVSCSMSESIRLVGGNSDHEGRVEVYTNGQWGTVCDDSWDIQDANVVCRQLGYIGAIASPDMAQFGQGTGPIHFDDVNCDGLEPTLIDCTHNGVGNHNCGHHEDAGVICSIDEPVRLQDGIVPNEGRVEILHNGVWGTVCDDSWGITDGTVICNQLGYDGAVRVRTNAFWGEGTGPIQLDDVGCRGNESSILFCPHAGFGINNCQHSEDAGVECVKRVRLVGGSNSNRGRVEVYVDGEWGTVCDDSWDLNDAQVVCRELGYRSAVEATTSASFGAGSGFINLDEVRCNGNEDSLLNCNHAGPRVHDCRHSEDAGAVCSDSIAIRLAGSHNNRQGRVEIQVNGIWGTICDDAWGIPDANVICRQLGLGSALAAPCNAHFGQGTGQIHLDDVRCNGTEISIMDCPSSDIGVHNCQHSEDAGVICSQNVNLRLAGSNVPGWGRVEVVRDGTWGTICDDSWDISDARVICRMLGFPGAISVASFGPGSGPIWLDNVGCSGTENDIADCSHLGWGFHNCVHSEDAGVKCRSISYR